MAERPRKTGPKILTFTAIAVLLAGVVAAAVGAVGAARGVAELVPSDVVTSDGSAGSDALALGPSTQPLTFDVRDRGAYVVFEVSRADEASLPRSAVTADGPDGPVSVTSSDQTSALPTEGWSVFPVGVLAPTQTGQHTLHVAQEAADDGVHVAVGVPLNADSVSGIGTDGLVLLVGLLVAGLGFLLLVPGIIWWALAKR